MDSQILKCFPGTPRIQQQEVLELIEKNWYDIDVFVVGSPVSTGKSHIAYTVAKYASKSCIIVPDNILLDQYQRDFTDLSYLRRKHLYKCTSPAKYHCGTRYKACLECAYKKDRDAILTAQAGICNYYMYLALRKNFNYKINTLIIDEAHKLVPMLTDLAAHKIWTKKCGIPRHLTTEVEIAEWIEDNNIRAKQIKPLIKNIKSSHPEYIIERTYDLYRGEEQEVIKLRPISVKSYKPILWPWCVQKIVLLSATISHKDIEELGLADRRVMYINSSSPINPVNRPVYYDPIGPITYRNYGTMLPKVAKYIENKLPQMHGKGVVHCTYAISERLRGMLKSDRFIFHTKQNKREKYQEFITRSDNCVLVACGLYEGIDLVGDLGRWQIIVKCPYPSLADSAIDYKSEKDPEWYSWETIKCILQASGRICRTPTDYGCTILLDSTFEMLYNKYINLIPDWFKESLKFRRVSNE